jgi:hypothetical protein
MLSGTALSNTWTDIGNLVTLLKGHPFDTKEKFVHTLSVPQPKGSTLKAIPDVTSLQRFLLAILLARRSESLSLPGAVTEDAEFSLNEDESQMSRRLL